MALSKGAAEADNDEVDYAGCSGLKEFMSETTMHGVQYIFRGAYLLRFIWLLGVLGALAGFFFFFATSVNNYLDYPSNTKIDLVSSPRLPTPAVTICNSNIIQLSAVSNPATHPYYEHNLAFMCELFDDDAESEFCPLSQGVINYLIRSDNRTARDILLDIGQSKSSLILDPLIRQINGLLSDLGSSFENSSAFNTIVSSDGICHTFNADDSRGLISRTGVDAGVKFIVNVDQTEYAGVTLLSAGVEVYLHTPGESIIRGRNVIYIGPGERANIVLKPERRELLDSPFRTPGCIEKNINRNKSLLYSPTQCLLECQEKLVATMCHCLSVSVPKGTTITTADGTVVSQYCSSFQYLNCSGPVVHFFQTTDLSLRCRSTCLQPCKPPANQYQYGYSLSSDVFPNVVIGGIMLPVLVNSGKYNNSQIRAVSNLTYLRENFAQINVFYDQLVFESIIEQQTVTLSTLFGSIGGNLGLFIGASLLTLLEYGQYITRLTIALLRTHRGKRKERNSQSESGPVQKRDTEMINVENR